MQASKLRLIQCGVGGFGIGWCEKICPASPDFELTAMVDVDPAALNVAGDKIGLPAARRFLSLQDALQSVSADAVLTVTPPVVHIEHARLAFEHGLHLMTEKPIADTLDNAKQMVAMARAAGRQLVVSQNYRYSAEMLALTDGLARQLAGPLGHGHLEFFISGNFTGTFREQMEYVLLVDMAVHHFDLIRAVTGRNIVKVHTQSYRPDWARFKHHPAAHVLMELEGGIPFTYCGDWSAKGRSTGWNGQWRLQCADGAVLYENGRVLITRSDDWGENQVVETVECHQPERISQHATLSLFAAAIRTGVPAPTSGEDNLWTFGAVMASVLSAQKQQTMDVRELLAA